MAKGLQIKPDGRHWLGNLSTSHCATVEHPIVIRSVLLIIIVAGLSVPNLVCAQTPPSSTEMPMTGMKPDRTVADKAGRQMMREKEAALRKKRSKCRDDAKRLKLSLLERRRFVRDCMFF